MEINRPSRSRGLYDFRSEEVDTGSAMPATISPMDASLSLRCMSSLGEIR